MPVPAQDVKTEPVEHESLANLGDPLRFVQKQPGDSYSLLIRQPPAELTVEVADRHRSLDDVAPVRLAHDARYGDVMLIRDVADDLFEHVFEGHDSHQAAVLIDNDGEMLAPTAKGLQLIEKRRGVGNEPGLRRVGNDVKAGCAAAAALDSAQQGLRVHHADDVIG